MYGVARGCAASFQGDEPYPLLFVSDRWCDVYDWHEAFPAPGQFVVNSNIAMCDGGLRDRYGRRYVLTRGCLERLQCQVIPEG